MTFTKYRPVRPVHHRKSPYGENWVEFSYRLRDRVRKCQWCGHKPRNLSSLAGHHIGCVKYNCNELLNPRVIIVVCRSCHLILEPWSKINLTQMLPQLYEKPCPILNKI